MDKILQALQELALLKQDFDSTRLELLAQLDKIAADHGRYLKTQDVDANFETVRRVLLDDVYKIVTQAVPK